MTELEKRVEWLELQMRLVHRTLDKIDRKTEPTISKMEQVDEPQTDTEIARAIAHKMIEDAVIAEDAYPDLRQRMHDAVDNYEPQTEEPRCSVNGTPYDECGFCEYFNCDTCRCEADVPQTERSE